MRNKKIIPLKELYISGKNALTKSGIENPGLEASLLLSKTLSINPSDIYSNFEREIKPEKAEEFNRLLKRRVKREPIAYILGEKEFYSRPFIVTHNVLIPRPETEILVEEILNSTKSIPSPSIIDIGTGSGCIAVTLGCEIEDASIFASDISFEAIAVTKLNTRRHDQSAKILFVCSDFLTCFKAESFDLVVSNPPYVEEADFRTLEPDVRDYEPKLSLDGGGNGLGCIRVIISQSKRVLKGGGWCILEIGTGQSERVLKIFLESGFNNISLTKDLSGMERVIKGQWIK